MPYVLVALIVWLAGCAGAGPEGETAAPTPTPATPTVTDTPTPTVGEIALEDGPTTKFATRARPARLEAVLSFPPA